RSFDMSVEIDEAALEPSCYAPADGALANAGQPDEHHVLHLRFSGHPASCPVTWPPSRSARYRRYPSRFRRTSLRESPPNFSSAESARTKAAIASAMTPMAGTAVTSLRSTVEAALWRVFISTDPRGRISVLMGFMATRSTSGSPVVMPPSRPPALLVRLLKRPRVTAPSEGSISS